VLRFCSESVSCIICNWMVLNFSIVYKTDLTINVVHFNVVVCFHFYHF